MMFRKRIFTPESFSRGLAGLITGIPGSIGARRHKNISHAFAEKLRLAMTSVNGCVYCVYAHTLISEKAGISKEEIGLLLEGEIGRDVDESEATALLFAQHYAETGGRPEAGMLEKLRTGYGSETSEDILAVIREMQMANLSGNTFEAFLCRLKGDAAPDSSALFEVLFFIVSLPFIGPLHLMMKMRPLGGQGH